MGRAALGAPSAAQARASLAERLQGRWEEIEEAAMTRLYGVATPTVSPDPEYVEGLRKAASAALRYLLEGVQRAENRFPEVPAEVLVQSRLAARCRVPLDTVVRRCLAGHALFSDFVMQEAEQSALFEGAGMRQLTRAQASLFDRLVAAVTEEYCREAQSRPSSTAERRAELVERLLAGEPLDASELAYDCEGHHLGMIVQGEGAKEALRELANGLDRRLLLILRPDELSWGWLGGSRALDHEALSRLREHWPSDLPLAIGEPTRGIAGWRLSHRQAKATWPIARRTRQPITRYGDVALFAAVLKDDLLATSLREIYLKPLEAERDGGEMARETLRVYFAAQRNSASAAAMLGITRQAVNKRLRGVEQRLGLCLGSCGAELEVALGLVEVDAGA